MNRTIVLTSNAYYPSIGGIENSLRHLAEEARIAGYSPKIIVGDIGLGRRLTRPEKDLVDGIEVIRYPMAPMRSPLLRWLNLFLSCFYCWSVLRAIAKKHSDTTVIARFHFNAVLAVWAGFANVKYLVPSVVQRQSGVEIAGLGLTANIRGRLKIMLHNWVQRAALRKCINYVFSETMRDQCIALAGNEYTNYSIVKPGVDGARFHPLNKESRDLLRQKFGIPCDKVVLLFVGRFVKAKGVGLVIEALGLTKRSDLHFVVVGDGAEKSNYLSMIERHNLTEDVTILPPTRLVEAFYQLADFFVMSSTYEPLGQTLLEAFASGLPVIAFRNSEFVDTATEELGMDDFCIFVDSYSSTALVSKLDLVLPLNNSIAAKIGEKALSKFSWSKLLTHLIG